MAAAPAVAAAVGVSRRGLAVFGPPAEDLVRAVVAAATGHAWRSLIDLKPKCVERRGLFTRDDVQAVINTITTFSASISLILTTTIWLHVTDFYQHYIHRLPVYNEKQNSS